MSIVAGAGPGIVNAAAPRTLNGVKDAPFSDDVIEETDQQYTFECLRVSP
jgi:hypothetical protein